jgi:hypothetical protein
LFPGKSDESDFLTSGLIPTDVKPQAHHPVMKLIRFSAPRTLCLLKEFDFAVLQAANRLSCKTSSCLKFNNLQESSSHYEPLYIEISMLWAIFLKLSSCMIVAKCGHRPNVLGCLSSLA